MGKPKSCGGGLCIKTPVLNNFSPIYYWEPIFRVEYRQTIYFLEKYMKYPFYPFYPFFGGSKSPRKEKKTVFLVQNFRKIAKKRVNRTKKVGTFH